MKSLKTIHQSKTSIVILTLNKLDYTKKCIESIREYTQKCNYEIIIVDNGSTDGTVEWLKSQKDIISILNEQNEGFPKGCNQGIEIAKGENILLLNNDTVATKDWLTNLLTCLYSSEDIGAVGPVTNSASYYSTVPVNYKSIEEMQQFAETFNVPDEDKWEERLKLIGFCMLIKRAAIDKIGLLDERFSPGNFEDDDYSLRLRIAGYKLLICKDTFIHHFGSVSWKENISVYANLLSENARKFKEKWGTNSLSYNIDYELIDLMPKLQNRPLKVLHIGCGSGGTLLKIKKEYPSAELFGIESNEFSVDEANAFASVCTNLEEEIVRRKFDVILFSVGSYKLDSYLLELIRERLSINGSFIAKLPNLGNCFVIDEMMKGNNPIKETDFYSLTEIQQWGKEAGFEINISGIKPQVSADHKQLMNKLVSISDQTVRAVIETSYFIVSGEPNESRLKNLLEKLGDENINHQLILEKINEYSIENILKTIINFTNTPVFIMNKIAIGNFTLGNHENVLPYLQRALQVEPNNIDTLYNLGYILNKYNEKELANQYLSRIKYPDEEVLNLIDETKQSSKNKIQNMTFLLRRLEFGIDLDETRKELINIISQNDNDSSLVNEIINTSIIDKVRVFQYLAIICFEEGFQDQVLEYLQDAYNLDQKNEDTLYNLGKVLLYYEENKLAERFLLQIQKKDEEVIELLKVAKGEYFNE